MKNDIRAIYKAFDGKLVGSFQLKRNVCEVVAKLPTNVIKKITSTCWFMGSLDDAWAFTFTGNDLKNQHLIFLSDELLMHEQDQIQFTIAHEIGHVILKHRNSVLIHQSKGEISKQEKEADEFARKYVIIES